MLKRGGFTGNIHPINPQYKEIDGSQCIPHLIDLPKAPDLVVLSVRNDRLEDTLKEAISIGAKSAVIFASGLLPNDTFPVLTDRLTSLVNLAKIPVCGGNCMGFYNNLDRVWVCGFPNPREPHQGSIALISHSGSVFGALAHNDPRLRFALTISPGQELNTTVSEYIDFALERPEVKVIGLFIETARDPSGFQAALAKAAKCGVPVVALKLGRTEAAAAAALTHTGALVGSDSAYQSIFDKYGVVRVETLDELASTLLLFSTGRSASQGSLVSIHDSGGECELFIDVADRVVADVIGVQDRTGPNSPNPFMNVLVDEINNNPAKPPALYSNSPAVKKELDAYFQTSIYNDPGDVFQRNQGQRQFVTPPSTSVPNDAGSFQDWLYRVPQKTCKEGNTAACVSVNNSGRFPHLT